MAKPEFSAVALQALRPDLQRFAFLQLRNAELAEDVVSETIVAVLEHPDRFAGQSSLKTYVVGILKHKIIDVLRTKGREIQLASEDDDRGDDEIAEALFAKDGHFKERPAAWGNPDGTLQQKEFFEILQLCLDKLPAKTGRVFMMREWLELESEEICQELAISPTNLWVLLYRARMRLRECLQLNWFGQQAPN